MLQLQGFPLECVGVGPDSLSTVANMVESAAATQKYLFTTESQDMA